VSLPRSFTDPVVIAKPLELSPQRGHTRIRNVQSDAFEIRVEEFGLQDDSNHPEVDVSYIVVEPGVTTLDGGTVLDAGTVAVAESGGLRGGFESVEFSQTLADPIAMAQTQTVNDTDAVTSHISSNKGISTNTIGGTGMEVKIENDSTNSATHAEETVGYIAIESTETLTGGEDTLGGVTFAAGDTPEHINENAKRVGFGGSYPDGFVADLQTFIGSQEHYLRYDARTDSGVDSGQRRWLSRVGALTAANGCGGATLPPSTPPGCSRPADRRWESQRVCRSTPYVGHGDHLTDD
jgi:hypothetical protein